MSNVDQEMDKREADHAINNFTRVANMLVDGYQELHPQDKWLFVCLVRLCGKESTRYLSLRFIAKRTGFSPSVLSDNKKTGKPGMIGRLHNAGLIHAEIKRKIDSDGDEEKQAQYHITITDTWALNYDFYNNPEKRSKIEQSVEENVQSVLNQNATVLNQNTNRSESERNCSKSERECSDSSTILRLQSKITNKITESKITHNVIDAANADVSTTSRSSSQEEFSFSDELSQAIAILIQHDYQIGNYGPIPGGDILFEIQRPDGSIYFDTPVFILHHAAEIKQEEETKETTPPSSKKIVESTVVQTTKEQPSTPRTSKETAPRRPAASGKNRRSKKDEIESLLSLSEIAAPQKPDPKTHPYNVELFMKLGDYHRGCELPVSTDPRSRYMKALQASKNFVQRKVPFESVDKLFCFMLGKGAEIGIPDLIDQKWIDGKYNTDLWTVEGNFTNKWLECQEMEKTLKFAKQSGKLATSMSHDEAVQLAADVLEQTRAVGYTKIQATAFTKDKNDDQWYVKVMWEDNQPIPLIATRAEWDEAFTYNYELDHPEKGIK